MNNPQDNYNYHYHDGNEHNPNNPNRPESERDRRLRLRDQERQRRNQGIDEGLKYGASQMMPPQLARPQANLGVLPSSGPIQQHQPYVPVAGAGIPQYQPIDMNQLAHKQQQAFALDTLNDRDPAYSGASIAAAHQAMQQLQAPTMSADSRNMDQQQLMRKSSKSKLNFHQAQELDRNYNQQYQGAPTGVSGSILGIGSGNQLDEQRREMDKLQRQQDYQRFLDQQRAAQQPPPALMQLGLPREASAGGLAAPPSGSPSRMKEKLHSARRLSSHIDSQMQMQQPAAPQESPNKAHRQLARANSSHFRQPQNTNILGQPIAANGAPATSHSRAGSATRARQEPTPALIAGGLTQIGGREQTAQEEKIRKQREYREFLDMQRRNKNGAPVAQKPPMPSPGANGAGSDKVPIMEQSRSNWDQGYLQERRRQIGEQVFDEIRRKSEQNFYSQQVQPQSSRRQIPVSQSIDAANVPAPSAPALPRSASSARAAEANPFLKNADEEARQRQRNADKKREYALELQQQIEIKKKLARPPKSPNQTAPSSKVPTGQPGVPPELDREAVMMQHMQQQQNLAPNMMRHGEHYMDQAHYDPQQQQAYLPPIANQGPSQQNMMNRQPSYEYAAAQQVNYQPVRPPLATMEPVARVSDPQSYQSQEAQWQAQMENDPRFQEILARKREEVRLKYEAEMQAQQMSMQQEPPVPQYEQPFPQMSQRAPEMMPPGQSVEQNAAADQARQRQLEYRRQLEEQMKMKEDIDKSRMRAEMAVQETFERGKAGAAVQHALPQPDAASGPNAVGRPRTDITKERPEESEEALRKKMAYQEELRQQMEEQKRQKELAKKRRQEEDERLERDLQAQRDHLGRQERAEMRKEGKDVADEPAPERKVNRTQFETSDEIAAREEAERRRRFEGYAAEPRAVMNEPEPPAEDALYKPLVLPRAAIVPAPQQSELAPPAPFQPPQQMQQNMMPPALPQETNNAAAAQLHQKLLHDQQQMIAMYQDALKNILEIRQNFFEESQNLKLDFMRKQQAEGLGLVQPDAQMREIGQLRAVQNQLSTLMAKVVSQEKQAPMNAPQPYEQQYTSIINPEVQSNLNDLIKTQRDKIVRMSQSMSFRDDVSPAKQGAFVSAMPDLSADKFDQSLSSNSRLVSVPGQFANKLKEKAQNIEVQRLAKSPPRQVQPNQAYADTSVILNQPVDQNNSWYDQQNNDRSRSPQRISNMFSTWVPGHGPASATGESQSINQRDSISPSKQVPLGGAGQSQQLMAASLIGSSQFQYMQQGYTPNQPRLDNVQSPPPMHQGPISPNSSQFLPSNAFGMPRPSTIAQPEPIQELPEREQNLDNTNDYDENSDRIRRAAQMRTSNIEEHLINLAVTDEEAQQKVARIQSKSHQRPFYHPQSEQVKNGDRLMRQRTVNPQQMPVTIDSNVDNDINNRDDKMSDYSYALGMQKSKASFHQGNPSNGQLDANLQFIENQIGNAKSKFPSQDIEKSPMTNDQMSAAHQNIIMRTEKSFYPNQQNMMATGMVGAKPMQTGSSFYNATMAKTEQQKLAQQETYQKQLLKIFSSDKDQGGETSRSELDPNDARTADKLAAKKDQELDNETQRPSDPAPPAKYQLPLDDTDYYEKASNINIAQSVAGSMDRSLISSQHLGIGGGIGTGIQNNRFTSVARQGQQGANISMNSGANTSSNLIDQQYNWLVQDQVINEQHELESKSKSKDTETAPREDEGSDEFAGQSIGTAQYGVNLDTSHAEYGKNATTAKKQSIEEQIEASGPYGDEEDIASESQMVQDANPKTEASQSIAFQFDGTQGSQVTKQFHVNDVDDGATDSVAPLILDKHSDAPVIGSGAYVRSSRKNWDHVKNSQVMSAANPYSFDPNSDHKFNPSVVSLKHQDQREFLPKESEALTESVSICQDRKANAANEPSTFDSRKESNGQSAISALNLGFGDRRMLSSDEPGTAEIVKNDSVFAAMKKLSPEQQAMDTLDSHERAQIDQLYEVRNSKQNLEFQKQAPLMAKLNDQRESNLTSNLRPLAQETSDIYPPQRRPFDPKPAQDNRHSRMSGLMTREIDPILDSTPAPMSGMTSPNHLGTGQQQFKISEKPSAFEIIDEAAKEYAKESPEHIASSPTGRWRESNPSGLDTQALERMTPSQRNILPNTHETSESYAKRVETDFEESIKDKMNRLDEIFKRDSEPKQPIEPQVIEEKVTDGGRSTTPPRQDRVPNIELPDPSGINRISRPSRPMTDASHLKNRELEDLARLIQEATGNVNNIVESSQHFMQTRQADRLAKMKGKQTTSRTFFKEARSPRDLTTETAKQTKQTIDTVKAEASPFQLAPDASRNLDHTESNATQMTKAAIEPSSFAQNDKIVTHLDELINNLEKQQVESQKYQSKFSSNRAFVTGTFPDQTPIHEENNEKIEAIKQKYEIPSSHEQSQTQQLDYSKKIEEEKKRGGESALESDLSRPVMVEENSRQFKLQKPPGTGESQTRPISGKSGRSGQTVNRYNNGTPAIQYSNQKAGSRKVSAHGNREQYQQFNDDEED